MQEITIDNRTVIPIRLIPFVTGWKLSPDVVVEMLAKSEKWHRVFIPSFHLIPDNSYQAMLPKEWDIFGSDLEILSNKLQAGDKVEGESYSVWRKRSIETMPAGTFVWLDDLKTAYKKVNSHTIFTDERPGDRELNLQPLVPIEMRDLVYEGFDIKLNELKNFLWGNSLPLPVKLSPYELDNTEKKISQDETEFERAFYDFAEELPRLKAELAELNEIKPATMEERQQKKTEIENIEKQIAKIHTSKDIQGDSGKEKNLEVGSPEWRSQNAKKAADARHSKPGGSRDKQKQMREIWASGKYTSKDRCAEEECGALDISFSAARKALRNQPKPK